MLEGEAAGQGGADAALGAYPRDAEGDIGDAGGLRSGQGRGGMRGGEAERRQADRGKVSEHQKKKGPMTEATEPFFKSRNREVDYGLFGSSSSFAMMMMPAMIAAAAMIATMKPPPPRRALSPSTDSDAGATETAACGAAAATVGAATSASAAVAVMRPLKLTMLLPTKPKNTVSRPSTGLLSALSTHISATPARNR